MTAATDPLPAPRRTARRLLAGLRAVLAGRRPYGSGLHDHDLTRWGLDELSDHQLRDIGLDGRVRGRRRSPYPYL